MGFDGWRNRWDLSVCHTTVGDVTIVRVFCLMIDNSCNSFGDILLLRLALVHGALQWFSFTIWFKYNIDHIWEGPLSLLLWLIISNFNISQLQLLHQFEVNRDFHRLVGMHRSGGQGVLFAQQPCCPHPTMWVPIKTQQLTQKPIVWTLFIEICKFDKMRKISKLKQYCQRHPQKM